MSKESAINASECYNIVDFWNKYLEKQSYILLMKTMWGWSKIPDDKVR